MSTLGMPTTLIDLWRHFPGSCLPHSFAHAQIFYKHLLCWHALYLLIMSKLIRLLTLGRLSGGYDHNLFWGLVSRFSTNVHVAFQICLFTFIHIFSFIFELLKNIFSYVMEIKKAYYYIIIIHVAYCWFLGGRKCIFELTIWCRVVTLKCYYKIYFVE